MKRKFFIFSMMLATSLIFMLSACGEEGRADSDIKLNEQQEQLMDEAVRQVGMPNIVNFQERRLAKQIFELRDQEGLITYAYLINNYTGQLIFIGKCIGFGLPYSVQYTNPVKYFDDPNGSVEAGSLIIPQADPNGLFMPTGLSATWLMMLDEDGTPRPVYVEPEIIVSPFPLHQISE